MVSFIDEHRDEHGVEPICALLRIAPSTYYEQKAREKMLPGCPRVVRDQELREEIERVWKGDEVSTERGRSGDRSPGRACRWHGALWSG